MKITPKKAGEIKVQEKARQLNTNNNSVEVTNEVEEVLKDAASSWQTQNVINSKVTEASEAEVNKLQTTDNIVGNQVPTRVLDLLSSTQNVGAVNTDVSDTINPYMPVVQVKSLPSNFTPYKLLVKNPEIVYKPYKLGEIKKINQSKMSVKLLFKDVLNGIECNFDKELITLADFTYIGLLRRISTLRSARFNANFVCQTCGATNKQEFDNTKLAFRDLECDLPLSVDFEGKEYIFTPLTIKDYLLLYDLDMLDDQIAYYAVQCRNTDIVINYPSVDSKGVKLSDEQRRFYTLYDFFYNLTSAEDDEVLDMMDTYLDHRLKPVELTCKGVIEFTDEEGVFKQNLCNAPISVTLDGGGVVITPFRESDEPVKSRIRFGTKKHS